MEDPEYADAELQKPLAIRISEYQNDLTALIVCFTVINIRVSHWPPCEYDPVACPPLLQILSLCCHPGSQHVM